MTQVGHEKHKNPQKGEDVMKVIPHSSVVSSHLSWLSSLRHQVLLYVESCRSEVDQQAGLDP
jgi:hypothetical protein